MDDDQILPTYIAKPQDPHSQPSQLHFFNSLMKLIHIFETSLSPSCSKPPWMVSKEKETGTTKEDARKVIYTQMSTALEQESKLAAWLDQLPGHLRFDFNNSSPKLRKQQRSLQTRYLHTRLMIHRPNMISALRPDKGESSCESKDGFLQSILTASIRQCIECSCELMGFVEEWYGQNSLGPWWLLLQCEFPASSLQVLEAKSISTQSSSQLWPRSSPFEPEGIWCKTWTTTASTWQLKRA